MRSKAVRDSTSAGNRSQMPAMPGSSAGSGVAIETSAAVVASRPEVSSTKVDAPFHQLDLTSNYESSVQHTHVESVPYIVASNGVQSSNTRDEEIRIPGNDQATAETTVEPFRGIAGIPSPPDFASTDDRDLFGSLNESEAAHMNSFLSETIPRTCRTLIGLSGYRNTLNHIEQLRKACKVKRVPLSGGQAGWIIDPDWLKSVGNNSPSAGVADPTTKQTPLQLPRTLFPVPRESASYVKPDNAVVLPASSGRSELTSSQKRVFDVVESSYALKGISPTIQELQTATSLNRFETFNEVDALVRKGLFEFDRSEARGIRIIPEAERVVPPVLSKRPSCFLRCWPLRCKTYPSPLRISHLHSPRKIQQKLAMWLSHLTMTRQPRKLPQFRRFRSGWSRFSHQHCWIDSLSSRVVEFHRENRSRLLYYRWRIGVLRSTAKRFVRL